MSILLLIAALATFASWLAGVMTKYNGRASDFQAHSSKYTSVLSIVYLGREVLKIGMSITKKQFTFALQLLYELVSKTQLESPSYE
jgi:hypothetical protein